MKSSCPVTYDIYIAFVFDIVLDINLIIAAAWSIYASIKRTPLHIIRIIQIVASRKYQHYVYVKESTGVLCKKAPRETWLILFGVI